MKTFLSTIILLTFICSRFLQAEDSLSAFFDDHLKQKKVFIPIIANQVILIKPDIYLALKANGEIKVSSVPALAGKTKGDVSAIKIPETMNATYQFTVSVNDSIFEFTVVTAFKDENTKDNIVEFENKKYEIGYYGAIPNNKGKVNYFKQHYQPPNWFFLWNSELESKSISKYILYKDIVVVPEPEPTDKEPPSRHSEVFTFSYETIINFEAIVDQTKQKVTFDKPFILSFYRTPNYNKKIGSSSLSRHVYGDAIDWYIDESPHDQIMDDLNKNNKVDVDDAKEFINTFIDKVSKKEIPPGGMGTYFTKKGASMHYDCRGHLAKWGYTDKCWPNDKLPAFLKEVEDHIKSLSK